MALAQQYQGQFHQIPSVDQVLSKLNQGQTHVTPLEWYCCLQNKAHWDQQQLPQKREESAILIWQQIAQDEWLCYFLLRRLLDQCQRPHEPYLAPSMLETVTTIYNQDWLGKQRVLANLVYGIYQTLGRDTDITGQNQKKINVLAFVASQHGLNKSQYLDQISRKFFLSRQDIQLLNPHFIENSAAYFNQKLGHESYGRHYEDWMMSCLNDPALSRAELTIGINTILEASPPDFASLCPQLTQRLIELRWQQPELYALLNDRAKGRLNALIGSANYTLFSELVDTLMKYSPIFKETRGSENKYRNQINKRRYFWSNYSDRFEAIRILVPPSSYQVLEQANHAMNYIEKLKVSGTTTEEETEVCLFDFGNYIIAEMFRGPRSKIHLIKKVDAGNLMSQQNLSLASLRSLPSESHSHKHLWQNDSERWLRTRNIIPNAGITQFKISATFHLPYHPQQGIAP